jgi:uncharacterized protein YjiS (DUF1127 family)
METIRLPARSAAFPRRPGAGRLGRVLMALMELWGKWRRRARERRHLAEFSDAMLKDIGISRADAMAEFDKPFWRP